MRSSSSDSHAWRRLMNKTYLAAAVLVTLVAGAHAQPSTNGPSGAGPEGAPPGIVYGSGVNAPGSAPAVQGSSKVASKHVKKTAHRHE